ncbi:LysR family transcriptional regulator [Streptomyces sp. H10-C2]|uniref:LysR family transcriptional regulator n=1 Tax=unclassified Streptomyces TaxID=2593676 RepID=UPI0024BBA54E|nr:MULTISPECIES: LysR family transcriptional regulator [unclassified Streptomyces]MDJ0346215.1 LysR family transcriptional regulator [Streptomyces sp. PH10-H1]MDJ0371729.1 LysR family transcriptional regulator [Streptomyces sp. H10-C2]
MERHEIETFLTLAEELHFRRTSARLGVAQGRVSQTIKKLERRIGVPLFERTSRRVALTPTGRQLRDDLLPAHEQIQQAIARAIATGRGITGTLRVGYSTPWVGDLALKAGDMFHARHPDCDVHFQEVQLSNPLGPLRSGELDLQISEFPIDEPDITAGPVIFSEPRALLVPGQHPFARQETVSVEDLARTPLVTIAGDIPQNWLDFHLPTSTPAGRPIPQGPAATYWPEVLAFVAAGKGVSPVSARAADYHARPGVAFIPFRDAPPIEYGLLWPTSAETSRVRAFVQAVCEAAGVKRTAATVG